MSVKWISHRGESIDAPENTLAAFDLSRRRHTDGMECDVMLSADGVVVISHDASTARMGDRALSVSDTPFAELAQVNVSGAWCDSFPDEHIPALADALPCLGEGREFFIELKAGCPALVPAVAQVLRDHAMRPASIVIISADRELVSLSKHEMPEFRALWLPGPYRSYSIDELIAELHDMKADGVNASGSHEELLSPELVHRIHDLGMLAGVAVAEQPEQARRIAAMGFDYITSSRAARLRDMLAEAAGGEGKPF